MHCQGTQNHRYVWKYYSTMKQNYGVSFFLHFPCQAISSRTTRLYFESRGFETLHPLFTYLVDFAMTRKNTSRHRQNTSLILCSPWYTKTLLMLDRDKYNLGKLELNSMNVTLEMGNSRFEILIKIIFGDSFKRYYLDMRHT